MAEETIATADWGLVPDHLHEQLEAWICFGKMPRSRFLLAVLAADLPAAELVASADEDRRLVDVAYFLRVYAPGLASGSLAKMLLWEFLGGLHGRDVDEMVIAT